MKAKMYRQGDVLLIKVADLPKHVAVKDNVLALGEKTGHYHEMVGEVVTYKGGETKGDILNGVQWVVAGDNAALEHKKGAKLTDDHAPLAIEKGTYQVVVQRDYESPTKFAPRDWD